MQQTLLWLKTWTAVGLLIALAVIVIAGIVLRVLVRRSALRPSYAIRVIETVSIVAGGAVGSVMLLLLLIILWPAGGNWVINTFLSDTLIWQTEFQQWITQKIDDPITSSAVGLLLQRIQLGSAFLGFLSGWASKWFLERLMGKGFHTNARIASLRVQSVRDNRPRMK